MCWVWHIRGHVGGPWGPVMFCLTLPVRRVVPAGLSVFPWQG